MENNENLKKEDRVSLIKRIIANLHTAQIVRKLNALILCTATVLTLNSCGDRNKNNNQNNSDDTHISQPENGNQTGNQSGNQIGDQTNNQSGNQSGGQTGGNNTNNDQNNNNTGDNTNDNQNNNSSNNNYSEYSDLLQYVLTNEDYNKMRLEIRDNHSLLEDHTAYGAHPFAFFEDQGYDLTDVLNNHATCMTSTFVRKNEPNNLYMITRIQVNANKPYFDEYFLKYTLTDQEMREYRKIYSNSYVQAYFINDAISEMKQPTILGNGRVAVETHESLLKAFQQHAPTNKLLNNEKTDNFTLFNIDEESGTFKAVLLTAPPKGFRNMVLSEYVAIATYEYSATLVELDENGAMYKPAKTGDFWYPPNLNEGVESEIVTYFNTYNVDEACVHTVDSIGPVD